MKASGPTLAPSLLLATVLAKLPRSCQMFCRGPGQVRQMVRFTLEILAERVRFELTGLSSSGFQDRRNRPLCHLSAGHGTMAGTLVQRFSRAHQSSHEGPSAFDLSVRSSDWAPLRPPLFAGEDASEAAMSGSTGHQLGGCNGVEAEITS